MENGKRKQKTENKTHQSGHTILAEFRVASCRPVLNLRSCSASTGYIRIQIPSPKCLSLLLYQQIEIKMFLILHQIQSGWETLGEGIIAVLSHEKLLVPRLPLGDYINLN